MEVIPSIDVLGGRCVRLLEGDFAKETRYPDDPLQVATRYAADGARRLHVVDLDAARGDGHNREVVASIVREAGVPVQVAGGIRSQQDVDRWLGAGAERAVMGTTAIREPEVLRACAESHPGRVIAALDARGDRPAVAGWTATEDRALESVLEGWSGLALAGVMLTSIDRDGTLAGPALAVLARVLGVTAHPVTYSGGIGSLDDLAAVARQGASAAVVGKALLEGRIELKEALASC